MRPNAAHRAQAAAKAHRPAAHRSTAAAGKKPAAARTSTDRAETEQQILDRLAALELAVARRGASTGDPDLDAQIAAFDRATQQQAESQRQMNVLREMMMEQRKRDEENLKKWIAMI
jgi:hypothetical protein